MSEDTQVSPKTQLAVLATEVKHVIKSIDEIKVLLLNMDTKFVTKEYVESRLGPLWKFFYIVLTAIVTVVVGGVVVWRTAS